MGSHAGGASRGGGGSIFDMERKMQLGANQSKIDTAYNAVFSKWKSNAMAIKHVNSLYGTNFKLPLVSGVDTVISSKTVTGKDVFITLKH